MPVMWRNGHGQTLTPAAKEIRSTRPEAKIDSASLRSRRIGETVCTSLIQACAPNSTLIGGQFGSLLCNIFLRPLIIATGLTCFAALRGFHLLHQIHVSGKITEALTNDFLNRIEAFVLDELRRPFLQFVNHLHTVQHHASAD